MSNASLSDRLRKLADRIDRHGDDFAAMAWVSSAIDGDPELIREFHGVVSPKADFPAILRRIAVERDLTVDRAAGLED